MSFLLVSTIAQECHRRLKHYFALTFTWKVQAAAVTVLVLILAVIYTWPHAKESAKDPITISKLAIKIQGIGNDQKLAKATRKLKQEETRFD